MKTNNTFPVLTFALLLLACSLVRAQLPQTRDVPIGQGLQGINAKWANGVGPGYWGTWTSGLTLNISSGASWCVGTMVSYAGGTLSMTNNTTNYTYLDSASSCAPAVTTSSLPITGIPLQRVTTSGGVITDILDYRLANAIYSISVTPPTGLSVSGSPVNGSGTFSYTWSVAGAGYLLTSDGANSAAWHQVNAGSDCGDSTHAVKWTQSTQLFGCQAISGSVTAGATLTAHVPVVGAGSSALATIASAGSSGQMLQSQGSGTDPAYFDFSDWKIVPAANCNNATAGNGWSLPASNAPTLECRAGTNNLGGDLSWANNNTTTNAQFNFQIPNDWVSTNQPYINIVYGSGANTSGTVKWTFSTACTNTDGSVSDDPSFNAESTTSGKTMATASRMWAESVQFTALTSGNNCIAGSPVIVKVTSGNGSATGAVKVYSVTISGARRPVNQAN